ncbi:MAG: hypothetical protein JNJ61_25630 [Anaerolineae bacterium]|nr:hypothetical protein [Anaerolineae bacterium]
MTTIIPIADDMTVEQIDAELARLAALYDPAEAARVAAEAAYKSVKEKADGYKAQMQALAVRRFEKTGEKTHDFVQAATETDFDWDSDEMLSWVLQAPRALQRRLLKLDRDAVRKWLSERLQDDGTLRQYEEMPPIIALKKVKVIGKVLAKELGNFLKGMTSAPVTVVAAAPLPTITPVPINITAFLTAPEAALASDALIEALEQGAVEDTIPF